MRDGRFRQLGWLSGVVLVALLLNVVLDGIAVVSDVSYHRLIQRVQGGDLLAVFEADDADHRQHAIGLAQIGLFVVTAVVFISWFRRAYANLPRLGASGMRWGPRWAVGAWFVPFLNLVRPKAIANEVWRGSNPDPSVTSAASSEPIPWYHTAWWAAFIAAGIAGRIAFSESRSAETLASLDHAVLASLVADAIDLLAACLAAVVVYRTATRQQERARALGVALRDVPETPFQGATPERAA